jgi:hypothetical protein
MTRKPSPRQCIKTMSFTLDIVLAVLGVAAFLAMLWYVSELAALINPDK